MQTKSELHLNRNTCQSEKVDRNLIFRQESDNTIFKIEFYNKERSTGNRVEVIKFEGDSVKESMYIQKMTWQHQYLAAYTVRAKNIYPCWLYRDPHRLGRYNIEYLTTLPALRLTFITYPEAENYIESIERSGASSVELPKVQLYGRYAYPFSIIVVTIVGFALASVRRPGGKGFYIAAGLIVSFIYLVMMKVIEPFGGEGEIEPFLAALLPHLFFLIVGIGILLGTRK